MGSCCSSLCRELDIRNLGLKFHEPRAFTESPAIPLPMFILCRLLFGALCMAAYVLVAIKHPTYLILLHFDYWSLSFVALYFIFGAVISLCHCISGQPKSSDGESNSGYHFLDKSSHGTSCALKPGEKDDVDVSALPRLNLLSWHHEVLWVLHSIAACSSLVVLVAYFSFWFHVRLTMAGYMDILQHVGPFLLMVVDAVINGFPVRVLHVIYANVFGAAYVVFTIFFIMTEVPDLRGNPATFPSLEFGNQPVIYTAWLSVYILVGFFTAQVFFYLLYKMRSGLTVT